MEPTSECRRVRVGYSALSSFPHHSELIRNILVSGECNLNTEWFLCRPPRGPLAVQSFAALQRIETETKSARHPEGKP